MLRVVAVGCRGHGELVRENLALRQQLDALKRIVTPAPSGARRLFWIVRQRLGLHVLAFGKRSS